MRFHDVDQNGDDWWPLRIGKLTGSAVSKVMANYGKAFGDPAKKLAISKAREMITGKLSLTESFSNEHTERGHIQEPIARALYEERTFCDVLNGGFFEDGDLGCSPDGRIGKDGLIEIKSVLDHVHYSNIKRGGVDPSYKWQVYFNLMLTGRDWIDFVSYCADFPEETQLYIYRIGKNECVEEFRMLNIRICEFFVEVEKAKKIIKGFKV